MRVAVAIVPEVRELLRNDPAQLDELLDEIHDEDLADLLKLLDEDESIRLLEVISPENAAAIFERLEEHEQERFVERFGAERLAPIVSEMAPDEATDLIEALPELVGDKLLDELAPEAAEEIRPLLAWPDDTAGGLMTPEFLSVSPDQTIAEVLQHIRDEGEHAETISYIYALDRKGVLVGAASLRDLLLAPADGRFSDIMMVDNIVSVPPETDQELVARSFRKYDFTALPVVDGRGRMLGVITVDDVIDVLAEEQTEDVQRLGAIAPIDERYFHTTFWTFAQKRAPWLLVLFVGEFFTGSVMRNYDHVIQSVSQLAHYVPLLISTGGNSGSQSASLIIRGLATGDIGVTDWWRVLLRELGQGLVLGLGLAAVGAARVMMVGDGAGVAVVIGVTVVTIVLLGCTVGGMLPILLRRVGLDPATSSTPFIATLIDVLGILLYLSVAKLVLFGALTSTGVAR